MWKKDHSYQRRLDAELFIKEALFKTAKKQKDKDKSKATGLVPAAALATMPEFIGNTANQSLVGNLLQYTPAGDETRVVQGEVPLYEEALSDPKHPFYQQHEYYKDMRKDIRRDIIRNMRQNISNPGFDDEEIEKLIDAEIDKGPFAPHRKIMENLEKRKKGVQDLDVSGYSEGIQKKVKELRAKGVKIQDDIPTVLIDKEIDKLRKKGLSGAALENKIKELRRANIRAFGGAMAYGDEAIGVMPGVHEAILAHEMGHVDQGRLGKIINKIGTPAQMISKARYLDPAIGLTAGLGALRAGRKDSDDDKNKAYRQAQIATGTLGLPSALSAVEEGRANINALNMGRKSGKFKEYAKVLAPAYGTYLAKASIPAMALGGLEYLRRKDKKKNKPMTKKAMRGKIIGGSTLLGALALGGNEYMKSRVNPETGITRREAARQARQAQDDTYASLTGKRRNALIRKGEQAVEAAGQKMDERKDIAVPAMAAIGGTAGGLSAKKALDFIKKNKRELGV